MFSANLHSAQFLIRRKRSWRDGFDAVFSSRLRKKRNTEKCRRYCNTGMFCSLFCLTAILTPHSYQPKSNEPVLSVRFITSFIGSVCLSSCFKCSVFCFGLVFDPHNTVKDHFMSYSIHSCMKLALLLNS